MRLRPPIQRATVRVFSRFDTSSVAASARLPAAVLFSYKRPPSVKPEDVQRAVDFLSTRGTFKRTLDPRPRCPICDVPLGDYTRRLEPADDAPGRAFEWADGSEHYIRDHDLWTPDLSGMLLAWRQE